LNAVHAADLSTVVTVTGLVTIGAAVYLLLSVASG